MKFTILIADDEPLERDALSRIFAGSGGRFAHVLVADTGRSAIELAAQQRVDIAILDIKMPGIDGLEAARQIRLMYPRVKVVFVTAFDYFEYARQALQLHADDFLVKPAEDEQVLRVVNRLISEIENEPRGKDDPGEAYRYVEQEFLDAVVGGHISEELLETGRELLDLPETIAVVAAFQPDFASYAFPVHAKRQKRAIVQRSVRFLERRLTGPDRRILTRAYADRGYLFFYCDQPGNTPGDAVSAAIDTIPGKLQIGGWAGISDVVHTISGLSTGAIQARIAARDACAQDASASLPPGLSAPGLSPPDPPRTVRIACYKPRPVSAATVTPSDERNLISAILEGDSARLQSSATALCDTLRAQFGDQIQAVEEELSQLLVFLARSLRLHDGRFRDNTATEDATGLTWPALCHHFHSSLEELAHASMEQETVPGSLSDRIITYIRSRYRQEITLDEIAEHVNLSPTHCSRAFTRQTGRTISRYITSCRITEARRLLAQPQHSIKEIASLTGFRDANYFTRIFTREEGISPGMYRRQLNILL